MTYKDVFELVKDKLPAHLLNSLNGLNTAEFITDDEAELLKLSLIQKWLRDDKGISVIITDQYVTQDWFAQVRYLYSMSSEFKYLYSSYEQALLEGINEALKII